MRVDVHQHLWTEPFVERLEARDTLPLLRRRNGLTILHTAFEQPCLIDLAGEAPHRRADLIRRDGLDRAVVAISSPIGIEALPQPKALELIDAYLEGAAELPEQFAVWGPVALDGADPDQVDRLLAAGCVGVSVPAGALSGPRRLDRIGPLLQRVAEHGLPLFVHPGPAAGDHAADWSLAEPLWWRPLTSYVSQMQAAWLTFVTLGRWHHPELKVVFSLLAGGAPLLSERLEARGGPPIDLRDRGVFYDTSSYGPEAIAAVAARVGEGQVLYGSDRPVLDPTDQASLIGFQENGGAVFASIGALV